VPVAFLSGLTGEFYRQFALTIAFSTVISAINSLTLSPALASQILQPHEDKRPPASWNFIARGWDKFTGYFNRGFDWLSHGYARAADFVIRHSAVMLLLYVALIGSAGWLTLTTTTVGSSRRCVRCSTIPKSVSGPRRCQWRSTPTPP